MYSRWLWQLTNPGMTIERPRSTSSAPGCAALRSADGPTATMRSPATATAPSTQHRRRDGQDPVGAVQGDAVVRSGGVGHGRSRAGSSTVMGRPARALSIGEPPEGANERDGRRRRYSAGGRRAILAGQATPEVTVADTPKPSFSPEVLTRSVWDAIKDLPGVHELYRNPLQSLGERVHIERYGPVRLEEDDDGCLLEIHLVATPDAHLPTLGDAVGRASLDVPRAHDRDADRARHGLRRRRRPGVRRRVAPVAVRALDLNAATRDLLAPGLPHVHVVAGRPSLRSPGRRARLVGGRGRERGGPLRTGPPRRRGGDRLDAGRAREPPPAGATPAGRTALGRRLAADLRLLLRRGVPRRVPATPPRDRGVAQAPPRERARGVRPAPRATGGTAFAATCAT